MHCLPVLLAQAPPDPPKPEILRTTITVTERISTEAPASITLVDQLTLRASPGVSIDDRLRQVPGFSLFRRSSSVAANPTTQGVSLRGIGSTGASRTLVLWDGIPANDPFGGWVYWTRLAPDEIEQVEVQRGASTSVFGDRAMGGALAVLSRPAQPNHLRLSFEGGIRNTQEAGAAYSRLLARRFGATANVRAFSTDGYFIVPRELRGKVDTPAGVRFASGGAKFDYLGARSRLFLRLDVLAEDRKNGTVLQTNSTSLGTLGANYTFETGRDSFSLVGYHSRGEFRANFSALAADRNSERLTIVQRVPSEAAGGAALWRRAASRWNAVAGGDFERVEGYSVERLIPPGLRLGGGVRSQGGIFGQANLQAGPVRLFGGLREHFLSNGDRYFNPSGGVTAGRGFWRARAAAYRAFRAPTLNELFRTFRAGNAETRANAALRAEELTGAEFGLDLYGESRRFSVTLFRNAIDELITNVTLSATPALVLRERRNAGSALGRGIEANFWQSWRWFRGEASYLFVDNRFATGARVPQVARHQGTVQVVFERKGTLASAQVRSFSAQFEDDRNLRAQLMPGFASVQFAARQRLARSLFATFALENALDRQYIVGFTPQPNIGPPRLWRAGLRWDGPLR
jgi:outer membrane cobalamin receptor